MDPIIVLTIIVVFVIAVISIILVSSLTKKDLFEEMQLEGFEDFYNELLNSKNEEFDNAWQESYNREKKRRNLRRKLYLIIDPLLAILLICLFLSNSIMLNSRDGIVVGVLAIGFVNFAIFLGVNLKYSGGRNDYQKLYKEAVVKRVINKFYSDLEYLPEAGMPEGIYRDLRYENYDDYISHDYFKGKIDNKYDIEMAEVLTLRETTDEDGHTSTTSIFSGLFAKIDLKKTVLEQLKIVPNREYLLDTRVKMDSVNFENYFDVIASDKIVATQLLTSDHMEKLVELQNKLYNAFDITIRNNELYIRVHCGTVFSDVSLKDKGMEKTLIKRYYYPLQSTYNIAHMIVDMIENTHI